MPVWSRSGSLDRRIGSVLPVSDDVEAFLPRKLSIETASNTARSLPRRRWLWLFLVVNLFGLCGFIFTSAVFFPPSSSAGVVEQAIKQGDVSLLEVSQPTPETQTNVPLSQEPSTVSDTASDTVKSFPRLGSDEDPDVVSDAESDDRTTKSDMHLEKSVLVSSPTNPRLRLGEKLSPITTDHSDLDSEAGTHITDGPKVIQTASQMPLTFSATEAPVGSRTDAPNHEPAMNEEESAMADLIRQMKIEMDELLRSDSPVTKTAIASTNTLASSVASSDDVATRMASNNLYHNGLREHLAIWLKADEGVDLDNDVECKSKGGSSCSVNRWTSQINSTVRFEPFDREQRPMLVSNATISGLPVIRFTCPMTSPDVLLHDSMTLVFVLSPTSAETGDTYLGQKFFGNSPYGQFLLHGGKPAYYTNGGLREIDNILQNHRFALITYRLHRHSVEIRLNGLQWGPGLPEEDSYLVRMSGNSAVSLGNVKGVCDTNAFVGDIAEILIYDRLLLDSQVDAVELYLRNKWLIPSPTTTVVDPTVVYDSEKLMEDIPEISDEGLDVPTQNKQLRSFDPEGVFEWKPTQELLQELVNGDDSYSSQQQKWAKAVNEKVEAIRNFQFGGEVLRSFIRSHRDELIALREDLFGHN